MFDLQPNFIKYLKKRNTKESNGKMRVKLVKDINRQKRIPIFFSVCI